MFDYIKEVWKKIMGIRIIAIDNLHARLFSQLPWRDRDPLTEIANIKAPETSIMLIPLFRE